MHLEICFWIFEKFRRKWRLKYTIWGPLRYVCGQTINPTSMICTCLESPTDLDVHPRKSVDGLAKIVEIDIAEVGTQNNEIWSCDPDRQGSSPVDDNFLFFLPFWYVMHYFVHSRAQISRNWTKLTYKSAKHRVCLLVFRFWWGPLRHVCGHANHRTTMVHTFL